MRNKTYYLLLFLIFFSVFYAKLYRAFAFDDSLCLQTTHFWRKFLPEAKTLFLCIWTLFYLPYRLDITRLKCVRNFPNESTL